MTNLIKLNPEAEQFCLIGGPSREDLRDSLGSKSNQRIKVTFDIVPDRETRFIHEFEAYINGMEWADGSGNSWNLTGWIIKCVGHPVFEKKSFVAHFDGDVRQGTLTFL
jgi:hypothetical protein